MRRLVNKSCNITVFGIKTEKASHPCLTILIEIPMGNRVKIVIDNK